MKQESRILHQARSIIAYVKNNPNHYYSEDEIMFTAGYIVLYHKNEAENRLIKR